MNTLKKIWNWLVWSSKDSTKISLTLKTGIPYLILVLSWQGIAIDGTAIQQLVDLLINAVILLVQFGLAVTAICGAYRKVKISINKI
jgi:hypothetical protein